MKNPKSEAIGIVLRGNPHTYALSLLWERFADRERTGEPYDASDIFAEIMEAAADVIRAYEEIDDEQIH